MNKNLMRYLIVWLAGMTIIGLLYAQANIYDPSNFNADARKNQPIPTGHVVGKDNGPGEGLHNTGVDCGICHTPYGKAGNHVFTVGGTIYEDRAATRPLAGAEVVLQDYTGNVISMTTNEVGNFWTYAPIASNPYSIASHGTTEELFTVNGDGTISPADPSDPRTWQYKAWIRNPDGAVRSMVTIAPVGGATYGSNLRMGCSMHHSPFGSTGAAWSSRVDSLTSYPSSALSFKKHILPIMIAKCAPCHVPGVKTTRLVTMSDIYTQSSPPAGYTGSLLTNTEVTSIDITSNLDLTAFASTSGKNGIIDFVNMSDVDLSLLLVKTKIGGLPHAGGTFWTEGDPDYKAIRKWIQEGAQNN